MSKRKAFHPGDYIIHLPTKRRGIVLETKGHWLRVQFDAFTTAKYVLTRDCRKVPE